jgi:hypothetical protein
LHRNGFFGFADRSKERVTGAALPLDPRPEQLTQS